MAKVKRQELILIPTVRQIKWFQIYEIFFSVLIDGDSEKKKFKKKVIQDYSHFFLKYVDNSIRIIPVILLCWWFKQPFKNLFITLIIVV